jgi:hypothetical protein
MLLAKLITHSYEWQCVQSRSGGDELKVETREDDVPLLVVRDYTWGKRGEVS